MSRGYTLHLRDLNSEADDRKIGVRLGRVCIQRKIPVSEVAERMGVTRATVYNWFCGAATPQDQTAEAIEAYLATLK